jgi:hypothetical protein
MKSVDPRLNTAIVSLQVAFHQPNCTERASAFPPRKAAAPLTAPLERLASKGPAETATIKPGGSPHNDGGNRCRRV